MRARPRANVVRATKPAPTAIPIVHNQLMNMRMIGWLVSCVLALSLGVGRANAQGAGKLPVRVVVVTTFELGNDTGDTPGEFQAWVERLPLPQTLPFPLGNHVLRYNAEQQVLGIVTGEG
jgi:purine nucleoside permease